MKTRHKILLAYFAICIACWLSISYNADKRLRDLTRIQPIEIIGPGNDEHELYVKGKFEHLILVENSYAFTEGTKIYGFSIRDLERIAWNTNGFYWIY